MKKSLKFGLLYPIKKSVISFNMKIEKKNEQKQKPFNIFGKFVYTKKNRMKRKVSIYNF